MALQLWETVTQDPEFQQQPFEIKDKVASNYIEKMKQDDPTFRYQTDAVQEQVKQKLLAPFAPKAPDTYSAENMQGAWETAKQGITSLLGNVHEVIRQTLYGKDYMSQRIGTPEDKAKLFKEAKLSGEGAQIGDDLNALGRVAASGINARLYGAPEAILGKMPPSETGVEAIARGGATFYGFLKGPYKVAEDMMKGVFEAAKDSSVAVNYVRNIGKQAATLSLASGISSVLPAMQESTEVSEATGKVIDSMKAGAILGAAYPLAGVVTNKPLRVALTVPLLDLYRNNGKFGIDDFVKDAVTGFNNGEFSPKLAEQTFNYAMDIYFLTKTPSVKSQIEKLIPLSNTDKLAKAQYDMQDEARDVTGAIKTKTDVVSGLKDMLKNNPEQFDAFDKALLGEKEKVAVDLIKGKNLDLRNTLSAMFREIGVKEKALPPAIEAAPTEPVTLPKAEPLSKKELGKAQKEAKEEDMVRTALSDKPVPAADLSSWPGLERLADDYVAKSGAESGFYMNKALEAKDKHEAFIKALTIRFTEMEKSDSKKERKDAREAADVLVKNVTGNAVERLDGYINLIKNVEGAPIYLADRVTRLKEWADKYKKMSWQQKVSEGKDYAQTMSTEMADIENEASKFPKFKQDIADAVKAAKMKEGEVPIVAEPDEIAPASQVVPKEGMQFDAEGKPIETPPVAEAPAVEVKPAIADQGVSEQPTEKRANVREDTPESLKRDIGLAQEMLTIQKEVPGKTAAEQSFNEDAIAHLEKTIPELQAKLGEIEKGIAPEVKAAFEAAEPVQPVGEVPTEPTKFAPETADQHIIPLIKARAEATTAKEKAAITKQIMEMKNELRTAMNLRDTGKLPGDELEGVWKRIVKAEREVSTPAKVQKQDVADALWEDMFPGKKGDREPTIEELKAMEAETPKQERIISDERLAKVEAIFKGANTFYMNPVELAGALVESAIGHMERTKSGTDFYNWAKKIKEDVGDARIEPYLHKAWLAAQEQRAAFIAKQTDEKDKGIIEPGRFKQGLQVFSTYHQTLEAYKGPNAELVHSIPNTMIVKDFIPKQMWVVDNFGKLDDAMQGIRMSPLASRVGRIGKESNALGQQVAMILDKYENPNDAKGKGFTADAIDRANKLRTWEQEKMIEMQKAGVTDKQGHAIQALPGHFAHYIEKINLLGNVQKYVKDALAGKSDDIINAVTGAENVYGRTKPTPRFGPAEKRTGDMKDFETNPLVVYRRYAIAVSRILYDKPAVLEARQAISKMPDGAMKDYATNFVRDYLGIMDQTSNIFKAIDRKIARTGARSLLFMNTGLQMLHMGRIMTQINPELGEINTLKGLGSLITHPQESYNEAKSMGLLTPQMIPNRFQRPMELVDKIGNFGDFGNGIAKVVAYEGSKHKIMDEQPNLSERDTRILAAKEAMRIEGMITPATKAFAMEKLPRSLFAFKYWVQKYIENASRAGAAAVNEPSLANLKRVGSYIYSGALAAYITEVTGMKLFHLSVYTFQVASPIAGLALDVGRILMSTQLNADEKMKKVAARIAQWGTPGGVSIPREIKKKGSAIDTDH